MSEPGGHGEVRDIRSGRVIGKTSDLWRTFCDNAKKARARGPCYTVASLGDVPDNVQNALASLGVPIVDDERAAGGFAVLVEGDPSEWWEPAE